MNPAGIILLQTV